jgi:hypothetical protein
VRKKQKNAQPQGDRPYENEYRKSKHDSNDSESQDVVNSLITKKCGLVVNDGGCCGGRVEGCNAVNTTLTVDVCCTSIVGGLMTVIAALAETFRIAQCEAHEPCLSRKCPRLSLYRRLSSRHRYPYLIMTRLIRSFFTRTNKKKDFAAL